MKNFSKILLTFSVLILTLNSCEKEKGISIIKVKLGAQANTTLPGFYSISENKLYTLDQAFDHQSVIDIFCFFESATGNNIALASPGSGITGIFTGTKDPLNYAKKDTTFFFETTITPAAFDALLETDQLIISSFDEANARRKAKDLKVDEVYSIKTEAETFGLLKITEVVQGETGSVEFILKMKK
jgi:hypothetical protein